MIKRILSLMLCLIFFAGMVVSCGESNTDEQQQEQPTPEPEPDPEPEPEPEPDPSDNELFEPYPGVPTPLKVYKNRVVGTSESVSIEITEVKNNNIIFNVKPGEYVQSYRLELYPLCRLYNSLYEKMRSEGLSEASERDIDTWIREFVFDSSGSGGFVFEPSQTPDYANKEFDWMNSIYVQANIVPDAEYIIVVISCFDTQGVEDGEMSMCYVRTTSETLVGDPQVEIDVQVNSRAMQVTHYPNSDCKYLYYWASDEADLKPYIDTYGRKLYSDFMRHTIGEAISVEETDRLWYYRDFGQAASSNIPLMATAIALDVNQTPAEDFSSEVFTLEPIPEGVGMGSGTIEATPGKVGASYFYYNYTIAANTPVIIWKVFTPEEAEYYKTQATEEELKALAQFIDNDGWGLMNYNYEYNASTDSYGEGYSGKECFYAEPETEYVFGFIARNRYRELSDVVFTDVIKTKPLVLDRPEDCKSDCVMSFTCDSRTKFVINFKYDFDKHAGVRFQYLEPIIDGGYQIPVNSTREEFIEYLQFGVDPNSDYLISNNWVADPYGSDSVPYITNAGTTYKFVAMFEDWDGVVSDFVIGEVTTNEANPGDNPEASISAEVVNGELVYTFTANEDTAYIKYMAMDITEPNDPLYLGDLGTSAFTPEEYLTIWRRECMNLGMESNALEEKHVLNPGVVSIAICIPFGANDVRGDVAYLIWDGTEAKTLSDYYPDYQTSSLACDALQMAASPRKSNLLHASEIKMPVEQRGDDVKVLYMFADMKQLSSHPLAKNR